MDKKNLIIKLFKSLRGEILNQNNISNIKGGKRNSWLIMFFKVKTNSLCLDKLKWIFCHSYCAYVGFIYLLMAFSLTISFSLLWRLDNLKFVFYLFFAKICGVNNYQLKNLIFVWSLGKTVLLLMAT
jgi:hypothetical protein